MRPIIATLAAAAILTVIAACSGKSDKPTESRWRFTDTVEYRPDINEGKLFVSLDEFEKLLFAPLSFFEQHPSVVGFSQEISFLTESKLGNETRRLDLSDKVLYTRDAAGDLHLSYANNHSEGWDLVWKDGFLYKKLLGGDYVRTYSAGEHTFLKETLFRMIPDLYEMLRERAEIASTAEKGSRRHLTIRFVDRKMPREPLPLRRYLQNSFGAEEMNNDRIKTMLAGKQITGVSGTLDAEVDRDRVIRRMVIDLSFTLADEQVAFTVRGERTVTDKALLEVTVPPFSPEYHRRSFEAGKNIMEDPGHAGDRTAP